MEGLIASRQLFPCGGNVEVKVFANEGTVRLSLEASQLHTS